MALNGLISPMKFDLVKAAICTLLATERDNQNTLAATAGKTLTEIDNGYDFNVFKDLFSFPDASQLPCVSVYNANGAFDPGKGYTDSKWHTYELAIDLYSISTAEIDSEGITYRADKLAAERLDYLWAQVFGTLCAEENWYKGLSDIIRVNRFTRWDQKRVEFASDDAPAEEILAIQSIFELQFEEPTETVLGEDLETLVASLQIDEEYISPFVTAQIA